MSYIYIRKELIFRIVKTGVDPKDFVNEAVKKELNRIDNEQLTNKKSEI